MHLSKGQKIFLKIEYHSNGSKGPKQESANRQDARLRHLQIVPSKVIKGQKYQHEMEHCKYYSGSEI